MRVVASFSPIAITAATGSSVVRLASNGVNDATFGTNGRAELPSVVDLCSTAVLLGARDDGSVVVGTRGS